LDICDKKEVNYLVKVRKKTEVIEPDPETTTDEPTSEPEVVEEEVVELPDETPEVKEEPLESTLSIEPIVEEGPEPAFANTFEISTEQLGRTYTCDIAALEQEIKLLAPRIDKDSTIIIKRLS